MGLGSGIRKKTYSGARIRVQGQKGTGSRIRIRNTDYGHFNFFRKFSEIFAAQGAPPVSLKIEKIFNHKNFNYFV
jgi:hypothetical protein